MTCISTVLAAGVAASAVLAGAAVAQDGERRQLGAHVHGEARLSVALDPASGLALAELSGAAWNFYGFERAPRTEAERETLAAVRTALSQDGLIAWPARAGCTLSEVTVDAALTGTGEDHDHGHDPDHGEDHDPDHGAGHDHGDGHDQGHGHDHGDEHDQGHDDDPDNGAAPVHNDVAVGWTYVCDRAAAATRFDAAGVFTALPRLERIQAEAFDGTRAAVRTLTPQDAVITLQ